MPGKVEVVGTLLWQWWLGNRWTSVTKETVSSLILDLQIVTGWFPLPPVPAKWIGLVVATQPKTLDREHAVATRQLQLLLRHCTNTRQ